MSPNVILIIISNVIATVGIMVPIMIAINNNRRQERDAHEAMRNRITVLEEGNKGQDKKLNDIERKVDRIVSRVTRA